MRALSGGGGAGGHLQGIQRLWSPLGDGDLLPIPGSGDLGCKKLLDRGGQELFMGKGIVEEDENNTQKRGGRAVGIRIFL